MPFFFLFSFFLSKGAIGKHSLVALSKHSWASLCAIGGRSGNILQNRIVEIQEFSRCSVSISQGNVHNFNFSKFNDIISANRREEICS